MAHLSAINSIDNRGISGIVNHMKVNLSLTLDIDAGAWVEEYGTSTDCVSIRNDVTNYIETMVSSQLRSLGLLNSMSTVLT